MNAEHVLFYALAGQLIDTKADEQAVLRMKIREIAAVRVRYGYKQLIAMLFFYLPPKIPPDFFNHM